jgi:hypothetical protein
MSAKGKAILLESILIYFKKAIAQENIDSMHINLLC